MNESALKNIPVVKIASDIQDRLLLSDLLTTECLIFIPTTKKSIQKGGLIFVILDDNFRFILGVQDMNLVFIRNGAMARLYVGDIIKKFDVVIFKVRWTYRELTLECSMDNDYIKTQVPTIPTAPPPSLVDWARKQNLLPITQFETKEEFCAKVYSCLMSIQDKISTTGAINPFWDIEYSGSSIKSRRPKKETDIHPIIHCILSDQMLMNSIEVIPEYQTGVGNLDFMFVGIVKGQGHIHLCVEFKNAHSDDIYHGLEVQLPLYMKNKNAEYGAYCVLGFKGNWFDEPKGATLKDLEVELSVRKLRSQLPSTDNIRIFMFDLSKPISASKQK
jgi:hypothetical protein